MREYGFSSEGLTFFYLYLKRRKQSVKINNTHIVFQVLLSGVPQLSILGSIVFNIFKNNIFYRFEEPELHNFADDNIILSAVFCWKTIAPQRESQIATDWFKKSMIINADKVRAIIVKRNSDMCSQYTLNIDSNQVTSEKSVKNPEKSIKVYKGRTYFVIRKIFKAIKLINWSNNWLQLIIFISLVRA